MLSLFFLELQDVWLNNVVLVIQASILSSICVIYLLYTHIILETQQYLQCFLSFGSDDSKGTQPNLPSPATTNIGLNQGQDLFTNPLSVQPETRFVLFVCEAHGRVFTCVSANKHLYYMNVTFLLFCS